MKNIKLIAGTFSIFALFVYVLYLFVVIATYFASAPLKLVLAVGLLTILYCSYLITRLFIKD